MSPTRTKCRVRESAGEVFPALSAVHVVDLIEHELIVLAAQLLREQALELADLRVKSGFRGRLSRLFDGVRNDPAEQ